MSDKPSEVRAYDRLGFYTFMGLAAYLCLLLTGLCLGIAYGHPREFTPSLELVEICRWAVWPLAVLTILVTARFYKLEDWLKFHGIILTP